MVSARASWTALVACVLLAAAPARADGPYEGQWREGPMNIRVTVQSWGGDCGPRPQSTSAGGGGTFRISQSGDQLTFHLRRQRTTRTCWSENRAVRRVSSSYQAGTWRVVCRTPQADSRAETGTYTIRAVGTNSLSFRDDSRYDWQLNESRCQASIVATQTFTRVGGGSNATTEPTETPTPRCTPGDPARVVLRPARVDVPPGGEQCFTARLVDAEGCTVRRRPRLSVEGEGSIEGLCYVAPASSGSATVVATSGSLRATAAVTVRTMDLSDLIARRSESASVGDGEPEDASSQTAARVTATPSNEPTSLVLPISVLAFALLLVGIAVVLLRRNKKSEGPPTIRGLPRVDLSDPPTQGPPPAMADDAPATEPDAPASPPGEDMICPTCRRGYPAGTERCPHDDTALMTYKDFASGKNAAGQAKENVCPVCGDRFPSTVRFCGKDGVALEPAD